MERAGNPRRRLKMRRARRIVTHPAEPAPVEPKIGNFG
jgi:hypothetical protein